MKLDPSKPGVYHLTRDLEISKEAYQAFVRAGGRIIRNGFALRFTNATQEAPKDNIS